jgi:hypothetical protein
MPDLDKQHTIDAEARKLWNHSHQEEVNFQTTLRLAMTSSKIV